MDEVATLVTAREKLKIAVRDFLIEESEAGYTEVMMVGILPDGLYKIAGKLSTNLTMVGALEYAKRDVMANNTPGAV